MKHCYVCKQEIFLGAEDLCLKCYDHLQKASEGQQRESLTLIAPALVKMLRAGLKAATERFEGLEIVAAALYLKHDDGKEQMDMYLAVYRPRK